MLLSKALSCYLFPAQMYLSFGHNILTPRNRIGLSVHCCPRKGHSDWSWRCLISLNLRRKKGFHPFSNSLKRNLAVKLDWRLKLIPRVLSCDPKHVFVRLKVKLGWACTLLQSIATSRLATYHPFVWNLQSCFQMDGFEFGPWALIPFRYCLSPNHLFASSGYDIKYLHSPDIVC